MAPVISDVAYDALYRELRDIEAAHPDWIVPESPTQRIAPTTVRGEAFMLKRDFEAANAERVLAGEEPWKNPRNAGGGALKLLDPREAARRPMQVLLYELVDGERDLALHSESLRRLRALGL